MEETSRNHSKQGIISFVLAIISILIAFTTAVFTDLILILIPSLIMVGMVGAILAIMDLRRGNKKLLPILALVISGVCVLLSVCALVIGSIYYLIING